MEEIISFLRTKAAEDVAGAQEGFCAMDWCGGNLDDAYALGRGDGEVMLARRLLKMVNKNVPDNS